ncbi:MAG: serine hydrolase [Bacteroidales bacterium]|nr:serine hydrolase [Bacteroidales bacterium]
MKKFLIVLVCFLLLYQNNSRAQNMSSEDSVKIDKSFYFYRGSLPGAMVCVLDHGKEVYSQISGLANNDTKEKLTRDHLFYMSSVSKIFTSMAIFQLIEMDKLSLDESIKDLYPELPEYTSNVKIKNLLSHTSGLVNYDKEKIKNRKELLSFLSEQDSLRFEAGTSWNYSNTDYILLAGIIEKKSKKSYKKFVKKEVFKKIHINKNQFYDEIADDLIVNGHNEKASWNYTLATEPNDRILGERGVYLSLDDLIKTENAIFQNKIISPEYSKSFNRFINHNGVNINYGYSWYIVPQDKDNPDKTIYWIGGRNDGFQNVIVHFPEQKVSVLLFINRDKTYYSLVKTAVEIGKLYIQ